MLVEEQRPDNTKFPGINADGLPTIGVGGHEISLAAYWQILELSEVGKSTSQIVNLVLVDKASEPVDRKVMAVIVKSILENIRMMNTTRSPNRASLLFSHLKPKKINNYRAPRLASETYLSASLDKIRNVQKEEGKLINETLRLTAQRDNVSRVMADGWEKRKTEAALDVEVRKYLKEHEALEAQLGYAKKGVELNRASLQ